MPGPVKTGRFITRVTKMLKPNDNAKCYVIHAFKDDIKHSGVEKGHVYTMDEVAHREGQFVYTAIIAIDTQGLWVLTGTNKAGQDLWSLLEEAL